MSENISAERPYPYGIIRVRDKRADTKVWRVSIMRRSILVKKTFADSKFGGTEAALIAAIAYRDKILNEMLPYTAQEQRAIVRSTNSSGVPGVYFTRGAWFAGIQLPNGSRERIYFTVKEYGDKARDLAIATRKAMLAEIDGYFVLGEAAKSTMESILPDNGQNADNPDLALPAKSVELYPVDKCYRASGRRGVIFGSIKIKNAAGVVISTTEFWQSTYRTKSVHKCRRFNIKKHGYTEALQMALDQRDSWETEYRQDHAIADAEQLACTE